MDMAVTAPEIIDIQPETASTPPGAPTEIKTVATPKSTISGANSGEQRVSTLSLSSIRAMKELEKDQQKTPTPQTQLPTEPFTPTDFMLQWNKYAQRLSDKGHKIMESLMLIADPKIEGSRITHELPNDSARVDFDSEKSELLGYLRGKLHNHDLTIDIVVNEKMDARRAFTPQDKYNRLQEINPNLELLRKTFDLEF